jgi:hypothetical protein
VKRSAQSLVIALVILLVGGHAAAVQGVGWALMFLERVQTAPTVATAVSSTLDGKRPCDLCRAADQLRQDPPTGDAAAKHVAKKQDKAVQTDVVLPIEVVSVRMWSWSARVLPPLTQIADVPVPPPRLRA